VSLWVFLVGGGGGVVWGGKNAGLLGWVETEGGREVGPRILSRKKAEHAFQIPNERRTGVTRLHNKRKLHNEKKEITVG